MRIVELAPRDPALPPLPIHPRLTIVRGPAFVRADLVRRLVETLTGAVAGPVGVIEVAGIHLDLDRPTLQLLDVTPTAPFVLRASDLPLGALDPALARRRELEDEAVELDVRRADAARRAEALARRLAEAERAVEEARTRLSRAQSAARAARLARQERLERRAGPDDFLLDALPEVDELVAAIGELTERLTAARLTRHDEQLAAGRSALAAAESAHRQAVEALARLEGAGVDAAEQARLLARREVLVAGLRQLEVPDERPVAAALARWRTLLDGAPPVDPRRLALADRLADAERRLADAGTRLATLVAERDALLAEVVALLGDDPGGNVVRALRSPVAGGRAAVEDLEAALAEVGVRVEHDEQLPAAAEAFLRTAAALADEHGRLVGELDDLERRLAELSVGDAELRSARQRAEATARAVADARAVVDGLVAGRSDAPAALGRLRLSEEVRARLAALTAAEEDLAARLRQAELRLDDERRRAEEAIERIEARAAEEAIAAAGRDVAEAEEALASVVAELDQVARAAAAGQSELAELNRRLEAVTDELIALGDDPMVDREHDRSSVREVEYAVMARVAAVRSAYFGGAVPIVFDDPFRGLPTEELRDLLEMTLRLSAIAQVIVLTEDPSVVAWASAHPRTDLGVVTLMEPTSPAR